MFRPGVDAQLVAEASALVLDEKKGPVASVVLRHEELLFKYAKLDQPHQFDNFEEFLVGELQLAARAGHIRGRSAVARGALLKPARRTSHWHSF